MTEKTSISKKEALCALWWILAELFDDKEAAFGLAEQSGVNPAQISTDGDAAGYWWRILVEAHDINKVKHLTSSACSVIDTLVWVLRIEQESAWMDQGERMEWIEWIEWAERMGWMNRWWDWGTKSMRLRYFYHYYAVAQDTGEPLGDPIIAGRFFDEFFYGTQNEHMGFKLVFDGGVMMLVQPEEENRLMLLKDEPFDMSISHARRIAKGHSSPFLVDLYLPGLDHLVKARQIEAFYKARFEEHRYDTELTQGLPVTIELASPSIEFTPPKKTNLSNQHNSIQFVGMPAVTTVPGRQTVLITIRSADNETEYFSRTFDVQVVDFAFDHVSRPKLDAAISVASAVGAVTMWALALLGQIDQTLGLAAGTAAAGASAFFVARIQWLYRAAGVTNQFHNQP